MFKRGFATTTTIILSACLFACFLLIPSTKTQAALLFYDCWMAEVQDEKADNISWAKNLNITNTLFTKPALEASFLHLRNYCKQIPEGMESPYLFDHLLDISFRQLDAYDDETLRYKLPIDKEASEWAIQLNELTTNVATTTPEKIINTFNDFRMDDPSMLTTTDSSCNVANYDKLNLYKRYIAACQISRCISIKTTTRVTQNTTQTSAGLVQSDLCETIVDSRKNTELAYIRQLISRSAVRTIDNMFTSYADRYFKERWWALHKDWTEFDQGLSFINRRVQEWTPVCSN